MLWSVVSIEKVPHLDSGLTFLPSKNMLRAPANRVEQMTWLKWVLSCSGMKE
jgi:hypothetical protein